MARQPKLDTLKDLAAGLWLAVISVFVFLRSVSYEALSWDDRMYIDENPWLLNLSLENVVGVFRHPFFANYHPVTMLSYMVDFQWFGYQPAGYRAENILLHAAVAVAGYALLRVMGGSTPVAFFAMTFFAVHPLRVESVVWISERKDVLCGLFYTLSLLCWVPGGRGEKRDALLGAASVAFAVLAMLSKAMAISLPLVMLLHEYLLREAGARKRLVVPFVLLGCAAAVAIANRAAQETAVLVDFPLWERLKVAAWAPVHYVYTTLWPARLSPFYPIESRPSRHLPWALLGFAVTAALLAGAWRWRRTAPPVAFAILAGGVAMAPVSGLVAFGSAYAADRYTYIPTLLVLAGLAPWLGRQLEGRAPRVRAGSAIAAAIACACLLAVCWRQVPVWSSTESLWKHVLSIYPEASTGRTNLLHARTRAGTAEPGDTLFDFPGDRKVSEFQVLRLIQAGRHREAIDGARRIEQRASSLYWQLRAAREADDRELMETLARDLAREPSVDAEQRAEAGFALVLLGDLDEGEEVLSAIPVPTITGTFAWGHLAAASPDGAQQERAARRSLAIFPGQGDALTVLFRVLRDRGEIGEARRILQRAARHPVVEPAVRLMTWKRLMELDEAEGLEPGRAAEEYHRALHPEVSGSDPAEARADALASAARIASECGLVEDALRLYREALEEGADRPAYRAEYERLSGLEASRESGKKGE